MICIFKEILSIYFIIPLVLLFGIYLSIKLNWLQIRLMPTALKLCVSFQTNDGKSNFSSFAAMAAVLGGNLGTGNIAGIAVALSTGGPGALFWMWVMAGLGAVIKFTGCFLGVHYREKLGSSFVGGPMYYLANGLGYNKLSKVFCVFTIISSLLVGNLVQINSVSLPLINFGLSPEILSVLFMMLLASVIIGGAKVFAKVSVFLVPIMAVIYVGSSLVILLINYNEVMPALASIFRSAFSPSALAGGVIGHTVIDAIRIGFDRGLFATDAGIGLAPILHSQVDSNGKALNRHAYEQGLVSIVAPFVVMVICMITGLVLMVTGAWQLDNVQSTNICTAAFSIGLNHNYSGYIVTITLVLFAFTTMLTWQHCAERAFSFLVPGSNMLWYRAIFISIVPIGVYSAVSTVWLIADIFLNGMLLINLYAVVSLSPRVIALLRKD